jgi:hypothetical protein
MKRLAMFFPLLAVLLVMPGCESGDYGEDGGDYMTYSPAYYSYGPGYYGYGYYGYGDYYDRDYVVTPPVDRPDRGERPGLGERPRPVQPIARPGLGNRGDRFNRPSVRPSIPSRPRMGGGGRRR